MLDLRGQHTGTGFPSKSLFLHVWLVFTEVQHKNVVRVETNSVI